MSASGLYYMINTALSSNQDIAAYYDFSEDSKYICGDSPYTGCINNSFPSNDTDLFTGYLINITGSIVEVGINLDSAVNSNQLDARLSNMKINTESLNFQDSSFIIDFEFPQQVHDGIILGAFEKNTVNINGQDIIESKGFNIGTTERGHLFVQTYSADKDQIYVLHNIELSKRNVIGISLNQSSISIGRFDYFNDLIYSNEINCDFNYLSAPDEFYFGASKEYFRSNDEYTKTFSGLFNSITILSSSSPLSFLKLLSSGIIGDYEITGSSGVEDVIITGYDETIIYKTGVTGYSYDITGTLEIAAGREKFSGSFSESSTESIQEGERYFKYYTLNNGSSTTFYKEELGFLHPDSGYIYSPTGEGAYDTLGLNDISSSIQLYIEETGIIKDSVTINLYEKNELTGTLNEISGIISTPLYDSVIVSGGYESGIVLSGDSSKFKKDYIYYLGERI